MDRFVRAFGTVVVALILAFCTLAHAGGPRYVAGIAYFDAAVTGKPIVWAGGQLRYYTDHYYTDLGDLSPWSTRRRPLP